MIVHHGEAVLHDIHALAAANRALRAGLERLPQRQFAKAFAPHNMVA